MASWVGADIDALVASWGPPSSTYQNRDGSIIYDYSYSGKKILLKEMSLNFNSFNKPVLITDNNGSSFKIEVRLIFDKFKIKVNN